jgi:hypothetical protein
MRSVDTVQQQQSLTAPPSPSPRFHSSLLKRKKPTFTHAGAPPLRVPLSLLRSHHPTLSPNFLRLFLVALGNMVERVMVQTVASLFSRGAITASLCEQARRQASRSTLEKVGSDYQIHIRPRVTLCHQLTDSGGFIVNIAARVLTDTTCKTCHVSVCCRSPPRGCVSRQPHVHLVARIDTLNQCPRLNIRCAPSLSTFSTSMAKLCRSNITGATW